MHRRIISFLMQIVINKKSRKDSIIAIHNTGRKEAQLLLDIAHLSMLTSKLIQSVFSAIIKKSGMLEAGLFQIIVGLGLT